MTTYYTQAQIDEIGALIGQEILNSNEALKQFVQDKIAALEPVTPPAPTEPEAGDGTTPAPAAGIFLDDGREIKYKQVTGDVNYTASHMVNIRIPDNAVVVSVSVILYDRYGLPIEKQTGAVGSYSYFQAAHYNLETVQISEIGGAFLINKNQKYSVLVGYLTNPL